MQSTPTTSPASATAASVAASVLRDRWLFCHAMSFLPGFPSVFHKMLNRHSSMLPNLGQPDPDAPSMLWRVVMRDCELRLVQRLYAMRSQEEYASDKHVQMIDVPICAAKFDRMDVLQWLEEMQTPNDKPWSPQLLHFATQARRRKVARWLLVSHPECCIERLDTSLIAAVRNNDFELFQLMVAFIPHAVTPEIMDYAASCGDMKVVRYLHDNKYSCTTAAMDRAAGRGYLEIVRFLHEHRTEGCTTSAMDLAVMNGHLEVVRFLHENRGLVCAADAVKFADRDGQFELINYLREKNIKGSTEYRLKFYRARDPHDY